MCKKILSVIVMSCLLSFVCYAQEAKSSKNKNDKFAEKVKAGIAKLGTGPDARIEVNLRDKTKLKGYISEADDEGFVVVDDKTGTSTKVPYPQVKKAKGKNNLSGEKIAIGIAIAAFVVLLVILYSREGP